MKGYVLVAMRLITVDGLPHEGESFVEPELLPHLETLGPAQCASFDEPVDATVSKAVLVTGFVESRVKCMITRRTRLGLRCEANASSRCTRDSRSKSCESDSDIMMMKSARENK